MVFLMLAGLVNAVITGIINKLSPESPVNHWRHCLEVNTCGEFGLCTAPEPFDALVTGLGLVRGGERWRGLISLVAR